MKKFLHVALIVECCTTGLTASWADEDPAERVVRHIVTLCLAGGSVTIEKGDLITERADRRGLVDGINAALNNLSADQANRARDCIKPFIPEIIGPEIEALRVSPKKDGRPDTGTTPQASKDDNSSLPGSSDVLPDPRSRTHPFGGGYGVFPAAPAPPAFCFPGAEADSKRCGEFIQRTRKRYGIGN